MLKMMEVGRRGYLDMGEINNTGKLSAKDPRVCAKKNKWGPGHEDPHMPPNKAWKCACSKEGETSMVVVGRADCE